MGQNYLRFWGTRGSCAVSGSQYARFGGNTSSTEIRYEDLRIVIDAGTGIRPLGEAFIRENVREIHLFLSHSHWDHLLGFPFFDPIYESGVHITIWSPPNTGRSCRELFADLFSPEFFPIGLDQVKADLEFRTIQQGSPLPFGDLTLDFHTTNHPEPTYCFKLETPHRKIGYVTDNEVFQNYHGRFGGVPLETEESCKGLIKFLTGCDEIIHEAQYTSEEYRKKVNWGHSSISNAAYLIQQTKARHWLVTHHDPAHSDQDLFAMEADARRLLSEHKIECKVDWIPDGYVLPILKEREHKKPEGSGISHGK